MVGGFGPLAGLAGRAWLITARRHLRMLQFAEEHRKQLRVSDACSSCGVREDDPFVLERVGAWVNGAQLRMQVTQDLRELITSFEQFHGVPPLPFNAAQWDAWLSRHEPFQTMCCRCVEEKGLEPSALPALALEEPTSPGMPSRPTSPTSPGTTRSRPPSALRLESGRSSSSDDAALPGLVDVEVSQASREMICYWATVARRRLRERKRQRELLQLEDDVMREAAELEDEMAQEADALLSDSELASSSRSSGA